MDDARDLIVSLNRAGILPGDERFDVARGVAFQVFLSFPKKKIEVYKNDRHRRG